tara:strand:- start:213 stop:371 length:159 start_codon:yes stop_codon:yes gene_type:complete
MKRLIIIPIFSAFLASCETTNVTPEQAAQAAEAARAWLDVAREAKTIILDDK